MSTESQHHCYRIGYALSPNKEPGFIQPSLLTKTVELGIDLILIDPNEPLTDQGPFDCIIHKIYGPDWNKKLQQFSSRNPNVSIIDSPESIERLRNRVSMLEVVKNLRINLDKEKVGVPNQVVVSAHDDLTEETKMRFPVIAKPLLVNGSENSHKMYLIFDKEGLMSVVAPFVLQEFVNHGGVMFKVYVAGLNVKCVKRRSLPDISEESLKYLKGYVPFAQISNLVDNDQRNGDDNCSDEVNLERAEMPSEGFVMELARALREALGLNLFNFDVIRDARDSNRYLVIDINYFPGYAKIPGYESILTDFFLQVLNKKPEGGLTCPDE